MEEFPSYDQGDAENNRFYYFRHRTHPSLCPRTAGTKMTLVKRYLIILFLQIGCLALDHSAREIGYEEDEIQLIIGHQFPGEHVRLVEGDNDRTAFTASGSENHQSSGSSVVSFHPKSFNFKESPVGMPRLGVVRVDNRLKDENLKLISISGNTVHFHSSFFADKVINPGGNTTFDVVFLSRMEGFVESSLYIHTSKGLFKYHVRGFGLPNPYRLRPLVGARIPVNGSYEPLITMHNPHSTRIQVVEMLSSGTDFHLKLPDGVPEEGEGAAWAIEPFQTKSVMKGSFHARSEGNHSGYIKIRVNSTTLSSEYLYVPVEVQVSSVARIYSPQDSLDFGFLVQSDKSKTLSLSLINAHHSSVNIQSVSVRGEANLAVRIEFRPLVLEPDSGVSTVVALVTFDPFAAQTLKQTHGVIEIRTECGQLINIPFRATVLQGDLLYNASALGFFVKADSIPPRNFSIRNNFTTSVAVYQVNVSHPDILQVTNFNNSQIISPGEQKVVFKLKVNKKPNLCDSNAGIQILLKTNVTNLRLPVTCYDGKLRLYAKDTFGVDFGRIELLSLHTEYFSIDNPNPVEVRLKSWGSNSSWAQVELVGMRKGNKEELGTITDFDNLKKSLFLQPGHMAVFSIDIKKPTNEGNFWGESYVTTDHDQTIRVPFRFTVAKGCITSETIKFEKAFPGKISFEKLYLASTFNQTTTLKGVNTGPSSLMWFTAASTQEDREILPHRKNYVGKVHLDPRKACGLHCYSGFTMDSVFGLQWLKGIDLNWETADSDRIIYSTFLKRFESVKKMTLANTSLWVETSEHTGYKLKTQVSFTWPKLHSSKSVLFPLTALSNETVIDIPISNPSNVPVIVQAVLAGQYGPAWTEFISSTNSIGNASLGNEAFSLDGVAPSSSHPNGSVIFTQVQRQIVHDVLGISNSSGILFFLQPGAKFFLRAKFRPVIKEITSTVLLLRNNLTGIETTWLRGRAGTGQLTLGNGISGSSLLFQLTERLLLGCKSKNEQSSKYLPPQLTVRRSFIARNVGEIPLEIRSLEVYPPQGSLWSSAVSTLSNHLDACEGYGFRILNCYPFTLLPNQTHSIDIAFTPDFTMARVVRSLRLTDSVGGQFNYSLVAMVPSGMLGICAAIISRPSWEPVLKYLLAAGIIIAMIAAALMAYFEAGSVVSSAVVATVRVIPAESRTDMMKDSKEVTTKLDLKAVYDKVDNRFKRNQSQSPASTSTSPVNLSSAVGSVSNCNHKQASIVLDSKETSSNLMNSNSSLRNRKKKGNSNLPDLNSSSCDSFPLHKLSKSVSTSGSVMNSKSNNGLGNSTQDSPSSSLHSTHITNSNLISTKKSSENSKKKKSNNTQNNQSAASSRKDSKSTSLINLTNLGSIGKVPNGSSKQQEEETSSTTTESSNPDDVMMAVMMARCDEEMREKERSYSGKSGSSGSSNDNYNLSKPKNSMKDFRKGSAKENTNNAFASPIDFEEYAKKNSMKKKDYNNRRMPSPIKFDPTMWDSPRMPGEGLSELAAQTQEFLNRPGKRDSLSSSNAALSGQGQMPILMHSNHQYGIGSVPQGSNTSNRNANRKSINNAAGAGVIGQHRLHSQMLMSSSQQVSPQTSFMESLLTSALPMTVAGNSGSVSTGSRQPSNPRSGPNQTWGNEILPDNGCDIWLRQNSIENANFAPVTTSSGYINRGPRHDSSTSYSNANGYFPSTNGHLSSQQALKPRHVPPGQTHQFLPPVNARVKNMASAQDPSFLFPANVSSNDMIINNVWQSYTPYENHSRLPVDGSRYVPTMNPSSQPITSSSQRNYLQRMRSDPASRRGFSTGEWGAPSCFPLEPPSRISLSPNSVDSSKDTVDPAKWPTVSTQSVNPLYGNWPETSITTASSASTTSSTSIANSSEVEAGPAAPEIWETVPTTASKWPAYGPSIPHGFPVTTPVVPPTRPSSGSSLENGTVGVGELGFRRVADVAQSHREVEAGLGFNPFTSDIWNQNQPENPGWSSNYRYGGATD